MKPLFPGLCAIVSIWCLACGPRARPPAPVGVEVPIGDELPEVAVDGGLAAPDAAVAPPEAPPFEAVVGVVLPTEGPSARLGRQLADVTAMLGSAGEDAPGAHVRLEVRSAADPASVEAAFAELAEAGAFGVVGLFDQSTARAAVDAAEAHDLPALMITVSDAAVKADGPTWRLLHTPLLVARTAAGVALGRGAKRALVVRPETGWAETAGVWFERVWQAGGGAITPAVTWNPEAPAWKRVVDAVRETSADALFVPCGPTEAAQLASHLAADGVWARRGSKPRFQAEDVREVWLLGPPEWYTPALLKQAARYLDGALIPVPYAVETARGATFAHRLEAAAGRAPTAFDALLADGIDALAAAHRAHEDGPKVDAVRGVKLATPRTSGLRFDTRDALPGLLVLQVTPDGFRPK